MNYIITKNQLKNLSESLAKNIALGAALTFSNPINAQDYVNPTYQQDKLVIDKGKRLEYVLSQIHNNFDADDNKLAVKPNLDSIKIAIKNHLDIDVNITQKAFSEFIDRIKTGNSAYGLKQLNGVTILFWKDE